jgi:hypothetical protein
MYYTIIFKRNQGFAIAYFSFILTVFAFVLLKDNLQAVTNRSLLFMPKDSKASEFPRGYPRVLFKEAHEIINVVEAAF